MNKKFTLLSLLSLTTLVGAAAIAINHNPFLTSDVKTADATSYEDVEYSGFRKTTNTNMFVTGAHVMVVYYKSGGYYAMSSNTHSFSGYNCVTPTEVYLKNNCFASYSDFYTIERNDSNRYAFQTHKGEDTFVSLSGHNLYTDVAKTFFEISFTSTARIKSGSNYISYLSNSGGGFYSDGCGSREGTVRAAR